METHHFAVRHSGGILCKQDFRRPFYFFLLFLPFFVLMNVPAGFYSHLQVFKYKMLKFIMENIADNTVVRQ